MVYKPDIAGPGIGLDQFTFFAMSGHFLVGAPLEPVTAATLVRVRGGKVAVTDERLFTYRSNVSTAIDATGARGYLDFAEEVVAAADRSACDTAGEACTSWLLDDVGARLFRRPLLDEERTRYLATFEAGTLEDGPLEGARWVLEAMLQSPSLLYLDEVTTDDGYLDDYSMASRLSVRWARPSSVMV